MKHLIALLLMNLAALGSSYAQTKSQGAFDVEARRAALTQPAFTGARAACLAIPRDPSWTNLKPIDSLRAKEGSGADGAANDYAWAVMVLSGRALAGDVLSEASLRELLVTWDKAKAFDNTQVEADAYYSLKRVLLPTIVSYSVLNRTLDEGQRKTLSAWIDALVRKIDKTIDSDVDRNDHRYLADSVLMAWGAVSGDDGLYTKGGDRYRAVLSEARNDGSLALEVRRGARALWYTRQSLASLTFMAEVAATRGVDLYNLRAGEVNFDRVVSYLLNGITEHGVIMAYASENHAPGNETDFRQQDMSFMAKRTHGRHYMAWVEPVVARERAGLASKRLKALFMRGPRSERPLIDEFVGGNATCFWGR
jgi:poly(beta-D-mannuronate) lyase